MQITSGQVNIISFDSYSSMWCGLWLSSVCCRFLYIPCVTFLYLRGLGGLFCHYQDR